MNVELDRLRKGQVPMVCAKTGAPTTHVRRQWSVSWNRASFWWILLSPGIWAIVSAYRSSAVQFDLPISSGVRIRYGVRRLVRLVGSVAAFAGGSRIAWWGFWLVGLTVWYVLHRWTRAAWVRAKWNGRFVRLDAHPDLISALRAPQVPGLPAWTGVEESVAGPAYQQVLPYVRPVPPPVPTGPAAGWYADPAGTPGLRYWDGLAWTEHVAAAAGTA